MYVKNKIKAGVLRLLCSIYVGIAVGIVPYYFNPNVGITIGVLALIITHEFYLHVFPNKEGR